MRPLRPSKCMRTWLPRISSGCGCRPSRRCSLMAGPLLAMALPGLAARALFRVEQGGDHMLAVEPDRAVATAIDAPAVGLRMQLNMLAIDPPGRAVAAGREGAVVQAQQAAAGLFGIAQAALQIATADGRAPVRLAQLENIQGHQGCLIGACESLLMTLLAGCKAVNIATAAGRVRFNCPALNDTAQGWPESWRESGC